MNDHEELEECPQSYWVECRSCLETIEFGEDDPTGRVLTCDSCGYRFIANQ